MTKLEAEGETNSVIEVKRASHLLIGPISRVNHDCHPNAEFTLQSKVHGQALTIGVTAKRLIFQGDEITVLYSNHYFGKNNKDCLCSSCELVRHNGSSSKAARIGSQVSKRVISRVTRQTAKQRKLKELEQTTYSYDALGDGLRERQIQVYHDLIPESDIKSCSVCRVRVAYSSVGHLCVSCHLRSHNHAQLTTWALSTQTTANLLWLILGVS